MVPSEPASSAEGAIGRDGCYCSPVRERPASLSFTERDTEGPSILHVDDYWYVYYDRYTRGRYGAVRTKDFEHWEKYTDSLNAPRGIRHGSAFRVPESVLAGLLALDSTQTDTW